MIENIDNSSEEITPPLPKGFKAIKKSEVAPPLPEGFNPIKKKGSLDSPSTTTNSKLDSEPKIGSLDGKNTNAFGKIDNNPVFNDLSKNTDNQTKPVKVKTDVKANQDFSGLTRDKTKGLYQKGEENSKSKSDIDNGFSNKTEYVYENGAFTSKTKTTYVSDATKNAKADYAKAVGKKSISEYDATLTEENLNREKDQSGVVNILGEAGKAIWNVTGEGLSAINETFGGDKGYFTLDEYKPLQDQKKQAQKDLEREGLPATEEAVQERAEAIFRKEDRIQQIEKRIDANLPENYDRQGIWKELKLDNIKNNDKLRSAVATIDIYQKQIDDFTKYQESIKNIPENKLTQEQKNTYNELGGIAIDSSESLGYYRKTFPKLLQEVKNSDELLDVMKFNYNDYEKAYSNITGFGKTLGFGTLKLAAETVDYAQEVSGNKGYNSKLGDAITQVTNEELDKNKADNQQFISYKAKDINNFSDAGSFMSQLATQQLPVYATLILAPEMGSVLLGTSQAGDTFRDMEVEEMQPFSKQTSFGQKLATAYLYGGAEALFEKLGTVGVLKNIEKSIAKASVSSRKLVFEGAGKEALRLGKQFGYNANLEGGTEYLTAEAQIAADRYVAGKDISTQQANERRSESYVAGSLMGGGMTLAGGVWGVIAQKAQLYSDGKDVKQTKAILSQINILSDELKNNPNLNADDKKIIYTKMNDLTNQSFDIVIKNSEKGTKFSAKENQFLVDITAKQEELKGKFEELKNSNISKEQKELLTKDLNNQYGQLEKDRNGTLKGEFATIPDVRKTITFSQQEDNSLKDNKSKEAAIVVETPVAETPKAEEVVIPEVQKSNEIIVPNLGDKIEIINESTPQGNTPTNPQVEGVSKVVEENKKADSPYDAINKEEALYREKQQKDKDKAINDIELIKSGDESTIDTYFKKSGYKEITSNEQDTRLKGKEGKFFRSTGASIIIKNSKLDVALDTAINVSNKKIKGLSNSRIEEIAKNFESEKSSKGNPPTNGDVQPGVQPVGESGVAKPETPAKEGVPSPVDGGKAKRKAEVDNTTKEIDSKIPEEEQISFAVTALPTDGVINYKDVLGVMNSSFVRYFNNPSILNAKAKKIYDLLMKGESLVHEKILLTTDNDLQDGTHRFMARLAMGQENFTYSTSSPSFFRKPFSETISEAYHKAKLDGSNPKLVKAVEDAIGKPTETPAKEGVPSPVDGGKAKRKAEVEKIDKEVAEHESEVENTNIRIENIQEEINNEKQIKKEEVAELKKKIAEVKKDKSLSKEEKAEKVEELNAEIEDLVDNQDAIIEQYKNDLTDEKSEQKKTQKRLDKLKEKKAAAEALEAKVETPESKPQTKADKIAEGLFAHLGLAPETPQAPTKKKPVNVNNKSELSNLEDQADGNKKSVIQAAKKAIATLKSVFPDMEIYIHEDPNSYNETMRDEVGGVENSAGNFAFGTDSNNKPTGKGRIDINLSKANDRTVPHEVSHGIMLKVFGDNPALFKNFRDRIATTLNESSNKALMDFANQYVDEQGNLLDVTYEEYLAELTGALATQQGEISPTTLQKIAALINEIVSKITNGKLKPFENTKNTKEVIEFFSNISKAIREGQDISNLNEDFSGLLYEPIPLNIEGTINSPLPSTNRGPISKSSRGDFDLVPHPIIDKNILVGKKYSATMSDHTKVGEYKNEKTGVTVKDLMGGVFYPYIKGVKEAGIAWASVTTKAARDMVMNAANQDYTLIYRMARATGSRGNVNFNEISFEELIAPVTNKKVTEKEFLSKLNSKLNTISSGTQLKAGKYILDKYGVDTDEKVSINKTEVIKVKDPKGKLVNKTVKVLDKNGKNVLIKVAKKELPSLEVLKKGLKKESFSKRGDFWSTILKDSWSKKSTGEWYKFLEQNEVTSLEEIVNNLAETEVDSANDHDIVAAIKIAAPEYDQNGNIKIYTTRKSLVNEAKGVYFIDAPDHPSYAYVVKGEPVGILNEFNSVTDYFPIINDWIKSKRLNSPYKAVETMGKELVQKLEPNRTTFASEGKYELASEGTMVSKSQKEQVDKAVEYKKESGTTQVATTTGSYAKAAKILKDMGIDSDVLDYGAGLGLGSDAMSNVLGFDVDSFEPNSERWKGNKDVTYRSSSDINKKYKSVVSLNVLNVVEKEIRDSIVKDIYNNLKDGGTAVISTRKWSGDVNQAKNAVDGGEKNSLYITRKQGGKEVKVFQKGFDGNELVDYIKDLLGDKVTVEKNNSFGASGVIIKKTSGLTSKSQNSQNSQIKDFIDNQRKAGETDEDIRAGIEQAAERLGLTTDDVNNLFVVKPTETTKPKTVKAVEEKFNPKQTESEKKADNDFKSKKGKKSLLGRLIEGGNPDNITDALKELGGDYDIRNQKDANAEAIAFIDKVGASEALKAVKDGLVTNSDVKMLIYDEALTRLKTEISDEINRNPEDREALIKKFQEVSDDFDNAVRDAGQGLAILNYIYNKNQTLKYNLKKQIADWKRNDPNREIPAEMKARMEELDKKLKNVEERTKEAEARAKVAEDELAIKNIQEDIERKNQAAKKNKSGLTPKEQLEKAVLRKEFYGAFNDVTRVATLLADPKFRRYLGLVFKTAKGDLANFSNEILSNLGKEAQKYLPELFKEASAEAKSKKQKSVKTEDEIYQEKLDAKIEAVKKKISDLENNIQKDVLGKNSIWGPELSKQQTILKKLREDRNTKQKEIETSSPSIKIGKDGKIKIPAKLLRDYVEAGETDIDVISQLIKDDLGDEFPDVDLIDIRDALTGYGKQINPNSDEITAQVNKLKEYGRLLSAYNDVMNGKMPLKSGLKREKPETRSRQLRRDINRLAKELNIEPIDLETQWASAIEKVKSQLENQIEDLNQQIAKGEKRKIERTSIKLDAEAEALKATRDALKEHLDNLVGKPELTEEQKITRAEKALKNSIKKIQEELDTNNLKFKEKPTPVNSAKIESLKAQKKALLETKKQLREQAGIIEAQRLKTAKTRIQGQIEDLKARIKNNDFSKKEVKPILADNELNSLRAEKEALYEHYDKLKYIQDQENRSTTRKFIDITLEGLALGRAIKASLDLGLIGIQLRGFTYAELWRNPKDLGKKFIKMLGAIGSQSKTSKAMSTLIGHPLYGLSKKLDIGVTQPDLRNEVREEIASGNLLHVAWNLPITIAKLAGKQDFTSKKTKSIGDTFIDGLKTQFNKISQKYQLPITAKEKFSREEQLENINIFEAIERGLSTYGNQLRFEEFVRGVDRLRAEGKDEINHLEDYQLLASYIRTFSGRANPASFKMNQKALNVFFFSFKNAASVFQQLNPVYYLHQHLNSTDFKNGNYTKIPVANKMAMATMFKSVASTAATMLFLVAGYNAFKDDDEEEMTIEKDPRSSDFGKLKVGDLRYDPWGGYIPLITLIARIKTEEIKKPDGTIYKMGEERNGVKDRGDATVRFIINKESPSFAMFHHYMTSVDKVDKITGEVSRVNHFGKKLTDDDVYSMWPIFLGSVKDAAKEDAGGYESFLTAYSILGLGNVQKYSSKVATPEDDFRDVMEKRKMKSELSTPDKTKGKVENRVSSAEGKIKEIERMKIAQKLNLTYYTSSGIEVDVSDRDFSKGEAGIEAAKNNIAKIKAKYGIKDKK